MQPVPDAGGAVGCRPGEVQVTQSGVVPGEVLQHYRQIAQVLRLVRDEPIVDCYRTFGGVASTPFLTEHAQTDGPGR
ncbi:hypothetical protein GCM10022226_37380 [Sphaerisporangium flaviroseum]|uniref:Uncharacterized protein n=1 Tax=Sphaerisporangium flaviroseum TaxID=509199 RepID=A0ABP7I9T5_9ACTN